MYVSGHDADLALTRRDDSRTVRPDQPRLAFELAIFVGADHVEHRNSFGDADNQRHLGVQLFHDRVRRERWRNEDDGSVRSGFVLGFLHRIEDRPSLMRGAALSGSHAADNLRAVSGSALGVESAFASGDALNDQPSGFIYEYRHYVSPAQPRQLFPPRPSCPAPPQNSARSSSGSRGLAPRWCLPTAAPAAVSGWLRALPPLRRWPGD